MPAAVAGGDYAVSLGRYATTADAERVVTALRDSQLPGYQETTQDGSRALHRVRIGPFATQADAEAARLRAAHVRDDVGAKVVVLDANDPSSQPATGAATGSTSVSQPLAQATPAVSKAEPLPESKPAKAKPEDVKPAPAANASHDEAGDGRPTVAPAAKPAAPAGAPASPCSWVRSATRPKPTSCATVRSPPGCTRSSSRCVPTRACSAAFASGRC